MQRSKLPEPSALSFEPEASSTGADLHPYDLSPPHREIMFSDVLPLERSSLEILVMKFCDARPTLYRGSTDIPTVNAWLRRHRRGASTSARRLVRSGKVHFFAEGFEVGRNGQVLFINRGNDASFTCCVFGKITPRIREWLEKLRARVRRLAPHEVAMHTRRFSEWMKIEPWVLR